MPSVKVSKKSHLSAQESYDRVTELLNNDSELRKLDPKYTCNFNSDQLSGEAKGSQFKAKMHVNETGDGCEVAITVDLPMLLTPIKGMVQKTLEKKLDKVLS